MLLFSIDYFQLTAAPIGKYFPNKSSFEYMFIIFLRFLSEIVISTDNTDWSRSLIIFIIIIVIYLFPDRVIDKNYLKEVFPNCTDIRKILGSKIMWNTFSNSAGPQQAHHSTQSYISSNLTNFIKFHKCLKYTHGDKRTRWDKVNPQESKFKEIAHGRLVTAKNEHNHGRMIFNKNIIQYLLYHILSGIKKQFRNVTLNFLLRIISS